MAQIQIGIEGEDAPTAAAAAHLYGKLAAGYQLAQALASTYQQLFKQNVRDWHLLRLIDTELQKLAKKAADGNPRLLEWLDKILQNSPKSPEAERGVEMILQKMADKEEQALNLCPAEEEGELASIYHHFGILKANKGEVDEAIALFNQSLKIFERTGNVQGKAATLHQLGMIYTDKGEVDEAIVLYSQSLEIRKRIGDVQGKAMTLWRLGDLAEQLGEYTIAISYLQPALEILQRLKSQDAESVSASLDRVMRNS